MNVTDLSSKLLQPIKFKGDDNEWTLWSKKFLAGARIKKYLPILEGKLEVPEVVENVDNEEDQKINKINDLND